MSIQSKVLREFTTHPGEILYKEDIAATTGLTEQQVANAVWVLAKNGQPIIKVADGSWKFDPAEASRTGRTLFEKVHTFKDGAVLLEDEDGTPWFAYREPRSL